MNINTLLFDLGGVLIELGSLEPLAATSELSTEQVQQNWLHSPSVRRFESGQCSEDEFATLMIEELSLKIENDEFLHLFNAWPTAVYHGADELITELNNHFSVACLSNTNSAHVSGFFSNHSILSRFEHRFLSHETGLLKPDAAAFDLVCEELNTPADQILFFDDHPDNVQAAQQSGMQAVVVNTPKGVINELKALGIHV